MVVLSNRCDTSQQDLACVDKLTFPQSLASTSAMIGRCRLAGVIRLRGATAALPLVGGLAIGMYHFFEEFSESYHLPSSAVPGDDRLAGDNASNASDRGARNGSGGPPAEAVNPGTNLFVTGIHPKLTEDDVTRLFAKYGEVEKCQIMLDPHTKESRGFGFVKMSTLEQADSAKEGLQGEVFEGRTLSIEKARRSRPRTPTPGKYFGPPKRGMLSVHDISSIAELFRR